MRLLCVDLAIGPAQCSLLMGGLPLEGLLGLGADRVQLAGSCAFVISAHEKSWRRQQDACRPGRHPSAAGLTTDSARACRPAQPVGCDPAVLLPLLLVLAAAKTCVSPLLRKVHSSVPKMAAEGLLELR